MRHGKKFNPLSRTAAHRQAMLSNMATSLILHKRINTTLAKAKALRVYVEPLVTRSKANTTHARRVVFSYLGNKEAIKELFGPVRETIGDRPGGYVRIVRTDIRKGDGAEMAMIEFVDFNKDYTLDQTAAGAKRRTRRGRGKSPAAPAAAGAATVVAAAAATSTEEE